MFPRGGFDARAKRRRSCKPGAMRDAIATLVHADPDKTIVMAFIAQLVAAGFARWEMLDDGDIELRFHSGEIFILAKNAVIRMA